MTDYVAIFYFEVCVCGCIFARLTPVQGAERLHINEWFVCVCVCECVCVYVSVRALTRVRLQARALSP